MEDLKELRKIDEVEMIGILKGRGIVVGHCIMDSGSFISMCDLFGFTPDRIARIVQDEAVKV